MICKLCYISSNIIGVEDANDGGAKQRQRSVPKNIRLRASILVNIRPIPGIQVNLNFKFNTLLHIYIIILFFYAK